MSLTSADEGEKRRMKNPPETANATRGAERRRRAIRRRRIRRMIRRVRRTSRKTSRRTSSLCRSYATDGDAMSRGAALSQPLSLSVAADVAAEARG